MAVDLQEMAPIEGVVQLQGDITDAATVQARARGTRQGPRLRHVPVSCQEHSPRARVAEPTARHAAPGRPGFPHPIYPLTARRAPRTAGGA